MSASFLTSSGAITASGLAGDGESTFIRLGGFSIRETAGNAATVEFRDGSSTGRLLASRQALAANQAGVPVVFSRGIAAGKGVYVLIVTGTAEVVVYGA